MYQIIYDVINSGRYELSDMLQKIDTIWVQGDIDDDQRDELVELARTNADPSSSYAPLQDQIDQAFERIAALETRVQTLEDGGGTTEIPSDPEDQEEEYPAYTQPTGAHDAYYNGGKCTYNGKKYICTAPEGIACVWSPDVYPDYWQEVEN